MALVFENNAPGPKTHVLLIGVGGYPYLKDGTQAREQNGSLAQLGQLTSPPRSVEALYQKFIEIHKDNGWITPLGSIELLLSPAPGAPEVLPGLAKTPATRPNIQAAYDAWKGRCDESEENVALFFYCGHGLSKERQFLLAEDFGFNPKNPWDGAFDFSTTREAFHGCKAQTQLFFVDACRQVPPEMLLFRMTISALDPASYLGSDCTYDLTIFAAASNESAYGKPNEPSYFTKALLNGLNGQAASNHDDEWVISTGYLGNFNPLLELVDPAQAYPQRSVTVMGKPRAIIRLSGPPVVRLVVECVPADALGAAALSYTHLDTGVTQSRQPPNQKPWNIDLEAGIYEVQAQFAQPPYLSSKKKKSAVPPSSTAKLQCL